MEKSFRGWRMFNYRKVRIKSRAIREELAWSAGLDLDDPPDARRAREMFAEVEEVLTDCVGLDHAIRRGPKRSHKIERLGALLSAQKALVRAIKDLDDWTWEGLGGHLDTRKCELPAPNARNGRGLSPIVPVAITELGRAAEAFRMELRRGSRDDTFRADDFRDKAIRELAEVFQRYASDVLRDPKEYRTELIGFVRRALRVARFTAPEDRKIWRRIPSNLKEPRIIRRKRIP